MASVSDGRMSGAFGKVPAVIHLTPDALDAGPIARICAGGIIRLDAEAETLEVKVDAAEFDGRAAMTTDLTHDRWGSGRELFAAMRAAVGGAEEGAMSFALEERHG